MPHSVLYLAITTLVTSVSSFLFLVVTLDHLEMAARVVIFIAAFIVLLGSYFSFEHYYYERKKLARRLENDQET